jgi:hypothetical protein
VGETLATLKLLFDVVDPTLSDSQRFLAKKGKRYEITKLITPVHHFQ